MYQIEGPSNSEPRPLRRDRSPQARESKSLSVNTSMPRDHGPFSTSPQQSRLEHPQESARTSARTWFPRSSSREAFKENTGGGGNGRHSPPPRSISVSPRWSSASDLAGPLSRYTEPRLTDRPGSSRGPPTPLESRPPVTLDRPRSSTEERTPQLVDRHISDAAASGGSLEGRLGDRYDEGYAPTGRQQHALPPNPTLRRDHQQSHPPDNRMFPNRRPMRADYGNTSAWSDNGPHQSKNIHSRGYEEQFPPGGRSSRTHPHYRPNYPRDESMDLDNDSRHVHSQGAEPSYSRPRPEMSRRGGSLLDRLSLDQSGDDVRGGQSPPHSQSLRDRVQVPSKRDRDDMMADDRYVPEDSFDGDDGDDPALKKMRRKQMNSNKPRKVKRGAP